MLEFCFDVFSFVEWKPAAQVGGLIQLQVEELRVRMKARATEELLPLVYDEPRLLAAQKMAPEPPGQTLQATALVHEAYVRLVEAKDQSWNSRGHFFRAAAEAMRRILIAV